MNSHLIFAAQAIDRHFSAALARAQRQYDRQEPTEAPAPKGQSFRSLMAMLDEQIDADPKAEQDISTAFVEAMYDSNDSNVLMHKVMAGFASDAELGAYVRRLMKKVALERAT